MSSKNESPSWWGFLRQVVSHLCVSVFPSVMTGWKDLSALTVCFICKIVWKSLGMVQCVLKLPNSKPFKVSVPGGVGDLTFSTVKRQYLTCCLGPICSDPSTPGLISWRSLDPLNSAILFKFKQGVRKCAFYFSSSPVFSPLSPLLNTGIAALRFWDLSQTERSFVFHYSTLPSWVHLNIARHQKNRTQL